MGVEVVEVEVVLLAVAVWRAASRACAFDKKIFSFESSKAERRPPRMRMTVSNIEMPWRGDGCAVRELRRIAPNCAELRRVAQNCAQRQRTDARSKWRCCATQSLAS